MLKEQKTQPYLASHAVSFALQLALSFCCEEGKQTCSAIVTLCLCRSLSFCMNLSPCLPTAPEGMDRFTQRMKLLLQTGHCSEEPLFPLQIFLGKLEDHSWGFPSPRKG